MSVNTVTDVLTLDGHQRSFAIRLPRTPPRDGPIPLVLALHGNLSAAGSPLTGGAVMRQWTTFDAQADAWGMAIAYPDGDGGSWADGRGVTAADEAGIDDVAFLRALLDLAAQRYGTSPDRNVVAGISNGAFMAHRMAMEAGDRVAVLAAVAGGLPAALCDLRPTHAVSAMLIHGTADRVAPIEGGHSRRRGPNGELRGRALSLQETTAHWRAVNGCSSGPGHTRTTALSSRTTVTGGIGDTQVTAWTVIGGGHSWPGTAVTPGWNEPTTPEFDAAEEICRFATPLLHPAAARRR